MTEVELLTQISEQLDLVIEWNKAMLGAIFGYVIIFGLRDVI